MSEENKEVCPKCGNSDFAIVRDMHSTRLCNCGETWIPKPKENKTVFEVGDKVEAFGLKGTVIKIRDCQYFPIQVKFCNDNSAIFCNSGKLQSWHLEPSLKLIEKAKKKVKKTIEAWAGIHKDGSYTLCLSEAIAKHSYRYVEIVKLTGEYEVEE